MSENLKAVTADMEETRQEWEKKSLVAFVRLSAADPELYKLALLALQDVYAAARWFRNRQPTLLGVSPWEKLAANDREEVVSVLQGMVLEPPRGALSTLLN